MRSDFTAAPAPAPPGPSRIAGVVLELRRVRVLRGPNPWGGFPLLSLEVRTNPPSSRLPGATSAELDGFFPGAPVQAAELVGHLASAMQRSAGQEAGPARTLPMDADGWSRVLAPCGEEGVARAAVEEAAQLVRAALRGEASDAAAAARRVRARAEATELASATAAVAAEAARRGIPVLRLASRRLVQLGHGRRMRRVDGLVSDATGAASLRLARNPDLARRTMAGVGVRVPRWKVTEDRAEGARFAARIGYPVHLRSAAAGEVGTVAVVGSAEELAASWPAGGSAAVLLEEVARGLEYDVLVVGGRTCAVAGGGAAPPPAALRGCERAARALGLASAAVHLRVPPRAEEGFVCGVDPEPVLERFTAADPGAGRAAAAALLDVLFPPGAPATVPVVAVTGTNGKTTTTRLIAHLLGVLHPTVAVKTTDEVRVGGDVLYRGDMVSFAAASLVLTHPETDAAVLEAAHGGIVEFGLGVGAVDVGVVLNVTSDHLGDPGIGTLDDLARVKRVVAVAAQPAGVAVLNADDPRVLAMREGLSGRVVLVSARGTGGGDAEPRVVLEDGWYVVRDRGMRFPVCEASRVPLTLGGRARFQHENVLAAIAAAWVLEIGVEEIRGRLLSFHPSPEMNPGRGNLLCGRSLAVLVDFAHNAAAMSAIAELSAALPAVRRLAVVGVPADRRDEDVVECGRLAAAFDYVVARERDRPGPRPPGETAALLVRGLRAGGHPEDSHRVILSEREAVAHALDAGRPGDLLVLLACEVDDVVAQVRTWMAADP